MRVCKCGNYIPYRIVVDGKPRNLRNRTQCLECLPFGKSRYRQKSPEEVRTENALKTKRWYNKKKSELGYCPISKKRDVRRNTVIALVGGCQFCGYTKCLRNITFHHLSGKDFGLSSREFGTSWNRLLPELMKCCVCCHNCHGEIHSGLISIVEVEQRHNEFVDKLLGSNLAGC